MSNNNVIGSRVLLAAIVALLFMVFGLASCGSGGGAAATATTLTASLTPSRSTGVAPLAVFFDASGTTDAGVTSRPFHDLEYRWDFGDAASGVTWAYGAQAGVSSKNSATGPVASHVFETPGTYTVTLTVFDGIKTTTTNTTITVTDPETIFAATNTICFSTAGNFTGCPAGATQVTTSNFVTALSGYQGATRRLLFKRGETFTAATAASITSTGPGIIGAFGVGAAPIVQMTGSSAILNLSSNATPTISDWRVMDLELDGLSQQASIGVQGFGGMSKVTMLRLNIHDVGEGFTFSLSTLDFFNSDGNPGHAGHALWDQIAIVDSSVQRVIQNPGGNGVFLSAQRFSLLGNFIDDSTLAEHIVRLPMIVQGVISNNTLSNQAPLKTILKLHGPTWCAAGSAVVNGLCSTKSPGYTVGVLPSGIGGDAGGYTEKVVISDNKLLSSDGTDWTVNTGPQNAQSDERLRDIIVERNWFIPGNTTSAALVINAARETVRNNICIIVNDGACLRVEMRGYGPTSVEPPPTDVAVYNNTFYTASAVSFTGVRVGVGAISTVIKNNLGYAPSGTGTPTVINDFGTSTVGAAGSMGNSSDAQVKNTSPSFAIAIPSVPADFNIGAGSYARDSGITVPVFSDFFRSTRPQSGVFDAGAIEYP